MWLITMEAVPPIASVYFILVVCGLVVARFVPQLHGFFEHGKLRTRGGNEDIPWIIRLFVKVAVPKKWFVHFYFLFCGLMAVQCVLFWNSTSSKGLKLLWVLLLLQATRRSWESVYITQWSEVSRMHISHYVVGLLFYVFIALTAFSGTGESGTFKNDGIDSAESEIGVLYAILAIIFAVFSLDQYLNHRHLAGLKKYIAPSKGLFSLVSCAHYFDEVVIYGSLTALLFVVKPMSSQALAFFFAWLFVVVNLSISASETREFYKKKFDDYTVRYSIIPWVY